MHTVLVLAQAINTQRRVALLDLSRLDLRESLNRRQTAVLRERERDRVEGGREGAHCVLLNRGNLCSKHDECLGIMLACRSAASIRAYLVGGLAYCERRADVGRTTTVDDTIIHDEVADRTDRIV